jgi:hypothetical protein
MVVPGLDALLGPDPGTTPGTMPFPFTASAPADALALFNAIGAQFPIVAPELPATRQSKLEKIKFRKQLPASYTSAFAFERPGEGTTIGTEFGCALRDTPVGKRDDPPPPKNVTWGAVLSFALRQPKLARALGLLHDITIPVVPSALLNAGGWLFIELDPAGPIVPAPDAVRRYAARMPALATTPRHLFAAVLLPVGLTSGAYDEALAESAIYDDGFGKIVHAAQAVTMDAASGSHDMLPPATDAGIDLGWDDEQVTRWLNRQLEALRVRVGLPGTAIEAPLGVSGYRIDVRMPDDPAHNAFESLCRAFSIDAQGAPAPLRFPPPPAAAVFTADFDDELAVEPTPAQSVHATDNLAWLPQHFTRWQDGSLVVSDPTLFQIAGTSPQDANGNPLSVAPPIYGAPPPAIRLRYGKRYEFRCRFADLTGGGPKINDGAINPAPHPIAVTRFLRHVQPKAVRLQTNIPRPPPTKIPPAVGTVTTIDVWRPLIGYPEMMFAGIDDPDVIAQVIANAGAAHDAGDAVGVNDPDVTDLDVTVEVRAPAHDPGPDPATLRDGEFRKLYGIRITFPPFNPADVLNPGPPLTLTLDYVDVADVATLAPPAAGVATLPVPRGRDVRLRLTPHCADKPNYFGTVSEGGLTVDVHDGLTVDVATRAAAQSEAGLFADQAPEVELNGILLQPAPDMLIRLAAHLDLAADGLTLSARPGERVVFGVSAALRHALSGDYGSVTFASDGELLGHWLAVIRLDLNRDWTWDGVDDEGFIVSRRDLPADPVREVGAIQMPFAVSSIAVSGPDQPGIDRRARTRLVFLDAVDPQPNAGQFPTLKTPEWIVEPRLRGFSAAENAALARSLSIRLPVAAPPRQTPKLVSAGVALSPYQRDKAYASTQPRKRVLWFEFAEPIVDPNDALFARVTAYGPDPLLSGAITHLLFPAPAVPIGPTTWFDFIESLLPTPPAPPALAIDPEPIRIIVPGQPEDSSGLDAMTEMEAATPAPPATSTRHYIVPLPPAIASDAPELFGFWTYELRIGHKSIWSTAQSRFGRPLEVKGVQHPAPAMTCSAFRFREAATAPRRIVAMAPHATAVFQDKRLTDPAGANDPRTRIWVLLYAQVMQADGATRRNVLIARAPATPQLGAVNGKLVPPQTRDVIGVAQFDEPSIEQKLADLALPADSPISVLAVELLPSDHLVQQTITIGHAKVYFTVDQPDPFADPQQPVFGQFFVAPPQFSDPLGRDLGSLASRRILRCSPLTPVAAACPAAPAAFASLAKKTLVELFKPKSSVSPSSSAAPATTTGFTKTKTAAPATATPAGSGRRLVWVNTETHVYHKKGSRFYGITKKGKYVSEANAVKEGDRPAAKGK